MKKTLNTAVREIWRPLRTVLIELSATVNQRYICFHGKHKTAVLYLIEKKTRRLFSHRDNRVIVKEKFNITGITVCSNCKKKLSNKRVIYNFLTLRAAKDKILALQAQGKNVYMRVD